MSIFQRAESQLNPINLAYLNKKYELITMQELSRAQVRALDNSGMDLDKQMSLELLSLHVFMMQRFCVEDTRFWIGPLLLSPSLAE